MVLDPATLKPDDYVRSGTGVYEVVSNEFIGAFPSSRRRILTTRDIRSEEIKIFNETEAKQLHKRGTAEWPGPPKASPTT